MPCYEPRDNPTEVRAECAREFRHNSDVAQLLCEVMRYLEGQFLIRHNQHLSPQLLQWWAEHQSRDTLKSAVEAATGVELDNYGRNVGLFRFHYETDLDFRARVLPRYV